MNWENQVLADLGEFKNGVNFTKEQMGEGLPVVNVKDITDSHYLDPDKFDRVRIEVPDDLLARTTDLFFVRSSVKMDGIGLVGKLRNNVDQPNSVHCGFVIRFRPNAEVIDTNFLLYLLLTPHYRQRIKGLSSGAAIINLSQTALKTLSIPIPPLDTQQRIAEILSSYDELIENNRCRIDLLEQSARFLYKEWFVSLRFPGHEHVKVKDGVPQGWIYGKVEDLGKVITGKTPSTENESNFGGEVPFVKTPDMHSQTVVIKTRETLSERGANLQVNKYIPRNAVMVACIGAKLGVVAIAGNRCQTNQQINSVVCHESILNYYAYFALWDLKPRLESMGGGATMPNVNKSKFSALPVLIPDKKILALFDEAVASNFAQIETLSIMNEKLQQARDLLLPRLMNGEIPV